MRSQTRALVVCCGLLPLAAACTTIVEQRVENELAEAGVPLGTATCMAEIWAEDLSIAQIRGIGRFAGSVRDKERRLTVGRLIGYVREWNDPQALGVVTTSAARCAFR